MSFLVELPASEYNRNAFAQFAPTGGFGMGTALAMAWMSQLAYETRLPDKIRGIGALFGLVEISILQQPAKSTLPLSDTRGIIANKDNALIIAFAGTDPLNLLNWVSDFYLGRPRAFGMRPLPFGRRSEQRSNDVWKRSARSLWRAIVSVLRSHWPRWIGHDAKRVSIVLKSSSSARRVSAKRNSSPGITLRSGRQLIALSMAGISSPLFHLQSLASTTLADTSVVGAARNSIQRSSLPHLVPTSRPAAATSSAVLQTDCEILSEAPRRPHESIH